MKLTYKIGDIEVNRLGYGGMRLTGAGFVGEAPDRPNAIKVIQAAADLGVNFFDTADSYGPHTNEILFGEALAPFQQRDVLVATKAGLTRPGPGIWVANGNPEYIRHCIDSSLLRLKTDVIDLWQLHRVDANFPLEETLKPVVEAVKAGKIRHVGLSEVSVDQVKQAQKILPIVSVQNQYNLANRRWEDVLDYTAANGMAFIPWFPLAAGPSGLGDAVHKIAESRGVSITQIALAWLLHRSDNILLIPGTKSLDHLRDNVGAVDIELTSQELKALSAV